MLLRRRVEGSEIAGAVGCIGCLGCTEDIGMQGMEDKVVGKAVGRDGVPLGPGWPDVRCSPYFR